MIVSPLSAMHAWAPVIFCVRASNPRAASAVPIRPADPIDGIVLGVKQKCCIYPSLLRGCMRYPPPRMARTTTAAAAMQTVHLVGTTVA